MSLERRVWNLSKMITLLMVLLSLRVVYWQLIRGAELQPVALDPLKAAAQYSKAGKVDPANSEAALDFLRSGGGGLESLPRPVVQRTMDLLENIRRGAIYDRDGRVLAEVQEQGSPGSESSATFEEKAPAMIRIYYEPSLAHVIGYVSGMGSGVSGLELSYNETLLGLDNVETQIDQLLHRPITGSDLILTIDSQVQRAADQALGGRAGAIIVMDAHDGAVLALASSPRYDPNRILEPGYAAGLMASCPEGEPACEGPFLNRATQALYTPGSTYKTVTLIAALDSGQVGLDTVFDFGAPISGPNGFYYVYEVDGGIVPDPNHKESKLDLTMSYAKSANAAFARIGDEMSPEVMIDYARRLGFGAPGEIDPGLEIESAPSQLSSDPQDLYENNLLRAVTAIGQGELLSTPMNTAREILAVFNQGNAPVPYFVDRIRTPGGRIVEDLDNRQVTEGLMKAETARQVREMMIAAVQKGSGFRAQVPGMTVGGKTGTAQVSGNRAPHAWFAGFAEQGEKAVVIVVLVENGGEGSETAAPVFATLAQTAIQQSGEPLQNTAPQSAAPPAAENDQDPIESQSQGLSQDDHDRAAMATIEAITATLEVVQTEPPATPEASPGIPEPDLARDPEKNDITAANPTCADARDMPEATGEFIWPSPYQALSGGSFTEAHPGFDLNTPTGSAVYAADSGLVIFAGWSGLGYGNAILIDHGNGYQTLYAHLSQISTYCGAKAEKGKLIGLSGSTGNSSGPHLHFEVRVPDGYLDPLRILPTP